MGSKNDSIKRVKMTLQVSTQKKSIENDSLEEVIVKKTTSLKESKWLS